MVNLFEIIFYILFVIATIFSPGILALFIIFFIYGWNES